MTLAGVAIVLAWIGVLITAALVVVCWRDPVAGLRELHHRRENLPEVMLGRYIGFAIMAVGFAVLQNLAAIAIFGAGLAFMAFHDAWTYHKAGTPVLRHVLAGVAGVVVTAVAATASITNGAVA